MPWQVYLVDDEPVFHDYVRRMGFWGQRFVLAGEAYSVSEALAGLERKTVDMVIMDVSMPGRNGVVLSRILAEKYPRLAILAVSSFDNYDYVREILKNGADDYILKSRLTEEFLLLALENISTRLKGQTPWEAKKRLRAQVREWILGSGVNPFTSDNSRKAAAIVWLGEPGRKEPSWKENVSEAVCRMIEEASLENADILAFAADPERIIMLTRFYGSVSEAELRRQQECGFAVIRDRIREVYHLRIEIHSCPFFFNDNSMRTFLLHKLGENRKFRERRQVLSLSLKWNKQLLSAVSERDADQAKVLVDEIYGEIPEEDEAQCIMITKELLDILEKAASEYRIELDFLPREFLLYRYARIKTREQLRESIGGLFYNLLHELEARDVGEKGYSDVVARAVAYQKEHFEEPISLSAIADGIGVNGSYLSRVFHEETGTTLTDYLNQIRIDHAKRLMEKDVPLKEIVSLCGFRNYNYFLRIFKRYTGRAPKEYMVGQGKNSD